MLALAAGVLAAATACTGNAAPAPSKAAAAASATPSPSAVEYAVTPAEAAKVFSEITASDDLLRVKKDPSLESLEGRLALAQDLTTGGQTQLTVAAYLSTGYAPPRYRWGSPTFFVPKFRVGEPALWFSALATRNGQPALLTFAKTDDWRISSVAELLPAQELPEIELDADGYATALAADDKSITISPQFMGPVHASVAETGSAGVTAGLLAPGPYTTDVAEQIAALRTKAKKAELSYDSIFSADNYPVYALRTKDGGALIQYSLSRNSTTRNMLDTTYKLPVPPEASWAIGDPTVPLSIKLTETHQYATAVPPLTTPKAATVIAHQGALTRAAGT
ncbi:hypothetical protein GCM10022419_000360 [Nonomuraea rosea]|uniref:DUF8094 domain-containing protein n=1 Tax=Nonomuraea rosea TaxID=638574 RepID=A0ABP6V2E5_9ACTN